MISQVGQEWREDGLALALEAHKEEHEKNSRQLMNLTEGKQQAAARPAYNPAEHQWPKHVYHLDGRDQQVADDKALAQAQAIGFRLEPYPPKTPATDAAKKLLESQNQIAVQNEAILAMRREIESMKAGQSEASPTPSSKAGRSQQ